MSNFVFDYTGARVVDLEIDWPKSFGLFLELSHDFPTRGVFVSLRFFDPLTSQRLEAWVDDTRRLVPSAICRSAKWRWTYEGLAHVEIELANGSRVVFGCEEFTERTVQRQVERESHGEPGPGVLAAGRHTCQHCATELVDDLTGRALVINRRKCMVSCGDCGRSTSVFAIPHRCRQCGVELESAAERAGQRFECPKCTETDNVPFDRLRDPARASESPTSPFRIDCPSCEQPWLASQSEVGTFVVCRVCRTAFNVPHTGEPVHSGIDRSTTTLHCQQCGLVIPVAASACPYCGDAKPR